MKRIEIGNRDLEKELSPFNGHLPFELREMDEELKKIEWELERPLLDGVVGKLIFAERNGAIYFAFSSGRRGLKRYGKIPADVQTEGIEAIKQHAEKRMDEALTKYDTWSAKCEKYMHNPDVVIEIRVGEVLLRGRIYRADHKYFWMRIEEPFSDEIKSGGYNQWSAMSGAFMFDHFDYVESDPSEMRLSSDALEMAKQDLVKRYEGHRYAERNKDTVAVVGRLNSPNIKEGG